MMTDAELELVEHAIAHNTFVMAEPQGTSVLHHCPHGLVITSAGFAKCGKLVRCPIGVVTNAVTRYGVAVCTGCKTVWVVWQRHEPDTYGREIDLP